MNDAIGISKQDSCTNIILESQNINIDFCAKKSKPIAALSDISFSAYAGKVTGLVGPDGAGKTTFLRLAAGLLLPSSGKLSILGKNVVSDIDILRCSIGYMPQQFGLYEDLTVAENLTLYADLKSVPIAERSERFKTLLEMTGLANFTKRRSGRLSGGMKQKLGLACCLIKPLQILLLDEPTVGVDPVSRRDLWCIIAELIKENNIGVIVATAYLDEADNCDKIIMLHEGKIIKTGSPSHFTKGLENRVFIVTNNENFSVRELQRKLYHHPEVIDATIRSGKVKIVVKNTFKVENISTYLPELSEIIPTTPIFEDAFMHQMDKISSDISNPTIVSPAKTSHNQNESIKDDLVVSVSGLVKKFGSFSAVQDINFQVRRGQIFGLLGSNGAGKTTTFRMLCGLLPATEGEISVAGCNLRISSGTARAKLGYMAQKFSLYRQLTVKQNLKFYAKAYGLFGKKLKERVNWALEEFDLTEKTNKQADNLNSGYKQRLAMGVAMVHEPDILFLDEPTSGADPLARREFWLRINGFARKGVTVIVTTHFMEEAEYCDHMLIMHQGKNLASGRPDEIRKMVTITTNQNPTMEDAFISLTENNTTLNIGENNV